MLTVRYTKPRGQAPDYSAPVVLRRNRCTVEHFCTAIHKDIVKQFKNGTYILLFLTIQEAKKDDVDYAAMVWGSSAKHARGQKVGLDHVLEDEEYVCFSRTRLG